MSSPRLSAVLDLKKDFEKIRKLAMLAVPPHPDHAPPKDPSMMQGGAPQQMPQDPSMMQGGAPQQMPQDPSMVQGGAPPQDPAAAQAGAPQQPGIPGELAAVMDKVVQKVEEQGRAFAEYRQAQEQRMAQLEQQLAQERAVREERKKIIDAVLPAV